MDSKSPKPLKNLRLVITGLDLQQAEHRGIAVYSKALIKALKASGAELWLLIETDLKPGKRCNRIPAKANQIIYASMVLDALEKGHSMPIQGLKTRLFLGTFETRKAA